jgi:RHS repeat-associated protein
LTSAFYVDDALASQEQAGVKISYNLDPAGRVRETVLGTKKTVNHYAGPGEGVAWTCEGSEPSGKCEGSEKWTREIQGFSGLVAVQTKGEAPVLELSDLHGDMIGIASISETESKLVPANETTEYGVPRTTISAKYSWLGADEVPTELPTGIIAMGARGYVPQLGRFEQTDPQPGGSTNAYSYTDDDPVNQADPSGENTITYHYGAVESGEAEAGLPEQYGAPGAIEPPPPNRQAEVEFAAHPPWDAAAAFNEGEGAPSAAEMAEIFGCTGDHACASFSFGAVVHWVSSNAHKLVAAGIGFVSSVVIGAVTLVAVTACTDTAVMTADPFVGYDCYKIGSIGFSVALAGMAASVQAWKVEKN